MARTWFFNKSCLYESNITIDFWLKNTSQLYAGTVYCDANTKYYADTKFQFVQLFAAWLYRQITMHGVWNTFVTLWSAEIPVMNRNQLWCSNNITSHPFGRIFKCINNRLFEDRLCMYLHICQTRIESTFILVDSLIGQVSHYPFSSFFWMCYIQYMVRYWDSWACEDRKLTLFNAVYHVMIKCGYSLLIKQFLD